MFISSPGLSGASEWYFLTAYVSFCYVAYLAIYTSFLPEVVNSLKADSILFIFVSSYMDYNNTDKNINNNQHLLSISYVSGTVLSTLHILIHLI